MQLRQSGQSELTGPLLKDLPPSIIPCADSAVMDYCAEKAGKNIWELMRKAGQALAQYCMKLYPQPSTRLTICCGGGNNGGDGYVAAKILYDAGYAVRIYQSHQPRSPLCSRAAAQFTNDILTELCIENPLEHHPDFIIDAMLGAGQSGPLRPILASLIASLNESAVPIIACDVPSGFAQENGLRADHIVHMQAGKQLARYRNSRRYIADLDIPPHCWLEVTSAHLTDFPRYNANAHKGQNGKTLVIGGGVFPGALTFACQSALRTGCDLVYAWTSHTAKLPPSIIPLIQSQPEAYLNLGDQQADKIALRQAIENCDSVLIGPGLGSHPASEHCAQFAFDTALAMGKGVVVDADGLSACAEQIRALGSNAGQRIMLTPHRAELKRVMNQQEVSWAACHQFAADHGVTILFKGVNDFITDGTQWQYHRGGNPRMSVGGSGDLLAGLCGGLMARRQSSFSAARTAVLWLCASADQCWQELGPCYRPEDIEQHLGPCLKEILSPLNRWPPVS